MKIHKQTIETIPNAPLFLLLQTFSLIVRAFDIYSPHKSETLYIILSIDVVVIFFWRREWATESMGR